MSLWNNKELFFETCAPQANLEASVTMLIYKVWTFSGGNQDRPSWEGGISYQKFSSADLERFSKRTEVCGSQPSLEFKSA